MKTWISHLSRLNRLARITPVTRMERRLLAVGGLATGCLLLALAWTCQQSVQRGERLRAEQRNGVAIELVIDVASAQRFGR